MQLAGNADVVHELNVLPRGEATVINDLGFWQRSVKGFEILNKDNCVGVGQPPRVGLVGTASERNNRIPPSYSVGRCTHPNADFAI